jgi:hypothetical protein
MQLRAFLLFNVLVGTLIVMPLSSAHGSPLVNSVAAIVNGVIIAHGNELSPPFMIAVENDTLCFYDGAGRRFARTESADMPVGSIPRPSLMGPAPSGRNVTSPAAVAAAQIQHLLAGGGLVAFGRTYLCVFPPAAAVEVLADVRWVTQHAGELSSILPPGDPLLQDLLNPAPLDPPRAKDDATLRRTPEGRMALQERSATFADD